MSRRKISRLTRKEENASQRESLCRLYRYPITAADSRGWTGYVTLYLMPDDYNDDENIHAPAADAHPILSQIVNSTNLAQN